MCYGIIGTAHVCRKVPTFIGTLVGVLTIGILGNGLVLWGMPSEVQLFVKGLVVILAVAVSTERKPNMIVK